jgi:hypothetical protein
MRRPWFCLAIVVPLFGALSLFSSVSADEAKKTPPTKDQIARWIRDLGSDDFDTRQSASKQLWQAGRLAEPALQDGLKNEDREVERRCREILDKFKWGVYPDTPPRIVLLIQRYQSSEEPPAKEAVIQELLDEGATGCAAIAKIASAENNPELRTLVLTKVSEEGARAIPKMIAEGNAAAMEELLEIGLVHHLENGIDNYLAFSLLQGKLDEKIELFKARLGKKYPYSVEQVLANLYRGKGSWTEARQMAEKSGKKELIEAILYEQGDWKELARRSAGTPGESVRADVETLLHQATYHRLAGNVDESNRILDEVRKGIDDRKSEGENDRALHRLCAKAFFLNERPTEGLALLDDAEDFETACGVLVGQLRVKDSFALLDRLAEKHKGEPRVLTRFTLFRARQLAALGEQKKAAELYRNLASADESVLTAYELIDAAAKAGLKDLAIERAAKQISLNDPTELQLIAALFPGKTDVAPIWWQFLRDRLTGQESTVVLKRLAAVLDGKAGADLSDWISDFMRKTADRAPEEREPYYLAIAEACQAAGKPKEMQAALEQACEFKQGSAAPCLKLGDHFAQDKEWNNAAERYRQAWNRDRRNPLPLYLQGWAQNNDGHEKEGKKAIELSHWMSLGNADQRYRFATELAQRGFRDDAFRERELILRINGPGSLYSGESLRYLGIEALGKKEFLKAADYNEKAMLHVLRPVINYTQPSAYIVVPAQIHRYRARGLLDAGKPENAMKEAQRCLAINPADIELPVLLVAPLEKLERKKQADEIFESVNTALVKFCEDQPQSAWGHNSIAWISAVCHRNLPEALKHARKANELMPESAGYLDTLAEVHFQSGDTEKAVELIRKCVKLEPKRVYFGKQLKRMEKGDPTVEVPSEAGDD